MDKDLSITKHNDLITAGYRLTLTEMQIVLYGASLINPIKNEFPRVYEIDVKQFAKLFNRDHGDVYNQVKDAIMSNFWEREFTFQDQYETDRDGNTVRTRMRWITTVKYSDKTGFLKVFFNPEIQKYLHSLKHNFTSYYIKQVSQFKRFYSIRFYEIAIMYLNKSQVGKAVFNLDIADLKDILEVKEKYKRFCDLKSKVLESSRKEINKHSDIRLSYEVIKQGRSPKKIKFTVTRKANINNHFDSSRGLLEQNIQINPATIEKANQLLSKSGLRWDIYDLEQQFYEFAQKKGKPQNIDKAFLGFVQHKIKIGH